MKPHDPTLMTRTASRVARRAREAMHESASTSIADVAAGLATDAEMVDCRIALGDFEIAHELAENVAAYALALVARIELEAAQLTEKAADVKRDDPEPAAPGVWPRASIARCAWCGEEVAVDEQKPAGWCCRPTCSFQYEREQVAEREQREGGV
jgi:hypothetical protein